MNFKKLYIYIYIKFTSKGNTDWKVDTSHWNNNAEHTNYHLTHTPLSHHILPWGSHCHADRLAWLGCRRMKVCTSMLRKLRRWNQWKSSDSVAEILQSKRRLWMWCKILMDDGSVIAWMKTAWWFWKLKNSCQTTLRASHPWTQWLGLFKAHPHSYWCWEQLLSWESVCKATPPGWFNDTPSYL